ncbi:cell division protein [Bordetella genomosp. 1]|uniref:Cell division protein n=1 Tax=Bordetella genomosp. 1 TaxID=1395607 RepID=A0A261SED5_9BORD|nr:translesion DNA synthesis-associated protein ImuA [Bordetella genomosp. 1]MDQ8035494.1 translesion DNA synthesis-associated protein ImuA [Bordetella sp.]OZI35764.1 cell division protein [Bordetella genomosp. 1]OZI58428.1 cell division protein [Bordetella genomosp. 1]
MPAPELIHPALWRATQLARGSARAVPTGHAALSALLPDEGWPQGSLTELLTPHPGCGELSLLRPALAALDSGRDIVLLQPPCAPHIAAWMRWGLDPRRLLWLTPANARDALWAADQVLKHGSCAALLCWLPQARPEALRRLHLASQGSETLFFALRPATAAQHASPAPLRLTLAPAPGGFNVQILKRRGPVCDTTLYLPFEESAQRLLPALPAEPLLPALPHAPLDRRLPAESAAGRRSTALV